MDSAQKEIIKKRINKTINALQQNNMDAMYAENIEQAFEMAKTYINDGDIVACGGSVTLGEVGITKYLEEGAGNFTFLKKSPELTKEEIFDLNRKALLSDVYFSSSNAITENGELFNVDGNANRVAALTFGPKNVVIIAGYNKIVPDIETANVRLQKEIAPTNTLRLKLETPCSITGECQNCKCPARICCTYVIHRQQRIKNRIKVILVGQVLGY